MQKKQDDISIEMVKAYEDNVVVVVRLDTLKNQMYVATMYDLPENSLRRYIHSGRLKKD